MYNAERKQSFIRYKKDTTELANNIVACFNDAEIFEEKYEKDLCDWTSQEIVGYLKYINTNKVSTLTVLVNMLRIYTDWCIANSLVLDHQNHYYEVTQDIINTCVDTTSLAGSIMTRKFLMNKLIHVYNASDRFVLLGSFEGLRTMDFPGIKISDIKNGTLTLKNRTIKISEDLFQIASEANAETSYISPIRKLDIALANTDYILKARVEAELDKIPTTELSVRFNRIMKYLDLKHITMKDLRESGRIEYIINIIRERSMSLDDVLANYRSDIENQYGKIQNIPSYKALYGPIIEGMLND